MVSQSSHGIARNGLAPSAEVKDASHSAQRREGEGGKCLPDLGQTGRGDTGQRNNEHAQERSTQRSTPTASVLQGQILGRVFIYFEKGCHCIDRAALTLTEIHLLLPPKRRD